jgi:TRAP-type mannitol/chloroaromatic compound transport system permease small subunit
LRAILKRIDFLSEWSGKSISWLILALIFALTYDTFMRYLFRAPTVWSYDISYMLGGTVMLMGMAYATLHRTHIRVDIIYMRLSRKVKLIIDLCFTALIYLPLFSILLHRSVLRAIYSFNCKEFSEVGFWRPLMWPFRWMIPVALVLLILAGLSWFIHDLYLSVKGKEL